MPKNILQVFVSDFLLYIPIFIHREAVVVEEYHIFVLFLRFLFGYWIGLLVKIERA
jgi:hypothetical protein